VIKKIVVLSVIFTLLFSIVPTMPSQTTYAADCLNPDSKAKDIVIVMDASYSFQGKTATIENALDRIADGLRLPEGEREADRMMVTTFQGRNGDRDINSSVPEELISSPEFALKTQVISTLSSDKNTIKSNTDWLLNDTNIVGSTPTASGLNFALAEYETTKGDTTNRDTVFVLITDGVANVQTDGFLYYNHSEMVGSSYPTNKERVQDYSSALNQAITASGDIKTKGYQVITTLLEDIAFLSGVNEYPDNYKEVGTISKEALSTMASDPSLFLDDSNGTEVFAEKLISLLKSETCNEATSQIINIPDANFKKCINGNLGRGETEQDIYYSDVRGVDTLLCDDKGVASIEGIQYFDSVNALHFQRNQITDISPISNLRNLQFIYFHSNLITELPVFNFPTNIGDVAFSKNQIVDISNLSNLTNVFRLGLSQNMISDVSPLVTLSNLKWNEALNLDNNQIADISPLNTMNWLANPKLLGQQIRLPHKNTDTNGKLSNSVNFIKKKDGTNPIIGEINTVAPQGSFDGLSVNWSSLLGTGEATYNWRVDYGNYNFEGKVIQPFTKPAPLYTFSNVSNRTIEKYSVSDESLLSTISKFNQFSTISYPTYTDGVLKAVVYNENDILNQIKNANNGDVITAKMVAKNETTLNILTDVYKDFNITVLNTIPPESIIMDINDQTISVGTYPDDLSLYPFSITNSEGTPIDNNYIGLEFPNADPIDIMFTAGIYDLKFNVYNDLGDLIGSKTVKLNVVASSNNAPVVSTTQDSYSMNKDDVFAFDTIATVTDAEDDLINSPLIPSIDYNGFNPSIIGTYAVIYSYTDTGGLTATKSITISVVDPNEPPIEVPQGELSISFLPWHTGELMIGQVDTTQEAPIFELPAFEVIDTRETTGNWKVQVSLKTFSNENGNSIEGLVKTVQRGYGFGYDLTNYNWLENKNVLYNSFNHGDPFTENLKIVQMESGIAKDTYRFGGFEAMLDFNSVDPSLLKPGVYQSVYSIKILDGP
jgi:hypothetical protein